MNAVLIISVLLLAFTAFALYRWPRQPSNEDTTDYFTPPRFGGLFSNQAAVSAHESLPRITTDNQTAERRAALQARAAEGDHATLAEAHALGDAAFYREVLDKLAAQAAQNDENLSSLVSHISQNNELRASPKLAVALLEAWQRSPDKRTLAEMLHIAALADDAAIYQQAAEAALQVWRDGRLPQVQVGELYALIENQYWMLASEAKRSGAGFILKRMLVSVRRELAAAARRASE